MKHPAPTRRDLLRAHLPGDVHKYTSSPLLNELAVELGIAADVKGNDPLTRAWLILSTLKERHATEQIGMYRRAMEAFARYDPEKYRALEMFLSVEKVKLAEARAQAQPKVKRAVARSSEGGRALDLNYDWLQPHHRSPKLQNALGWGRSAFEAAKNRLPGGRTFDLQNPTPASVNTGAIYGPYAAIALLGQRLSSMNRPAARKAAVAISQLHQAMHECATAEDAFDMATYQELSRTLLPYLET